MACHLDAYRTECWNASLGLMRLPDRRNLFPTYIQYKMIKMRRCCHDCRHTMHRCRCRSRIRMLRLCIHSCSTLHSERVSSCRAVYLVMAGPETDPARSSSRVLSRARDVAWSCTTKRGSVPSSSIPTESSPPTESRLHNSQ